MPRPPLNNLDFIKEVGTQAHQIYLDNWETKTQVAENNGEWNPEIQHRVLESIEKISSDVQLLCHAIERILEMNDIKVVEDD